MDSGLSIGSRPVSRRRLPLFALYAANAVSRTGDVLMFLAVPWFVLQTTGSVAQTGIAAFFSTASIALSAVLGSAFVDRLGYQRASVVSDLASMLGVALIPLLYATVGLPFWALLALVFVAGLLTTPGATARESLVPDLADLAGVRMERATAVADGVTRLSRFVGAPLAGVLIAVIGTSNLLWIDAVTFAFSALAVGLAIPARLAPHPAVVEAAAPALATAPTEELGTLELPAPPLAADGEGGTESETGAAAPAQGYFARIASGFGFLWRDPWLRGTVLVVLITNLLDAGQSGVLAPAFVKQVYGNAVVLGALIAAFGGAAFVGTLAFGAIGHRLPRRLTLGVSFTLGGASRFFWIVLLAPWPIPMIAVQAVCGFFIGPVNPLFDTVAYERVPAALRARVFGALTAGAMLGTPLGGLIAGLLGPAIGVEPSMLVFGTLYAAATLSLLVNPGLRVADERPSPSTHEPAPEAEAAP
ncbi:MAG TPA: MFS transporter [Ktedonobacterales bacterium]